MRRIIIKKIWSECYKLLVVWVENERERGGGARKEREKKTYRVICE